MDQEKAIRIEKRLIDANALLSKGHFVVRTNDFGEKFITVEEINKMPTVDAVPVVRCKNCRWACLAPQRQTATCMKNRLPYTHDYDYFCADGERKDDED